MTSFDTYDLIALWEQDRGLPAAEQAVLLLELACPDKSRDQIGALTIGERDRILLELRTRLFGNQLDGLATCTQCDEQLEVELQISDFVAGNQSPPAETHSSLRVGEVDVSFRLPTTNDAVLVSRHSHGDQARRALLRQCIVSATQDGASVAADQLDDVTLARIAQELELSDPLSEIRLQLTCSNCEHIEFVLLDIASYLWTELISQAEQLLDEVRLLAREYGWREMDILSMSGRRRQFYLDRRVI
ncbi:MAG: phage baseplate protein [Proteobacteria bacterium]|nr:phage baseplate protein [Pseudomonadota bacterium]